MPNAHTSSLSPSPLSGIRDRLTHAAEDLRGNLRAPNLPGARASVSLFQGCLRMLSEHAGLENDVARLVETEALYLAFGAFVAFRAGDADEAAVALQDAWSSTTLAGLDAFERVGSVRQEVGELHEAPDGVSAAVKLAASAAGHREWLILFHQAVEQMVSAELATDQGRSALRSLITRLELGQDDVGRMFGVSGETVRRWERGLSTIPVERRAAILAAEAGLRRLQDLFLPDRLAAAIRRPAELFDGEAALDWILRGRIAEVAARYDAALLYQA